MNILIAGGTGFLGSALVIALKKNHQVTVLGRHLNSGEGQLNWQDLHTLEGYDVVINLAGENIGEEKWTFERKKNILTSRIETTHELASLCAIAQDPKPRLLNASAIGIYGLQEAAINQLPPAYDENSAIDFTSHTDFLSEVARAWEQETLAAVTAGCDVTWLRFGVILDPCGGALKKMLPAFKWGFGSIIGSGQQAFTWVSRHDAIRAIEFIIEQHITGPICISAPHAVTQRQFAQALAKELHRPCYLTLPRWLIRILFGQMGEELLLRGQHVKPLRLHELGFSFDFPTIEKLLKQML